MQQEPVIVRSSSTALSSDVSKVLRNTYMLLAMTLAFSAFTATVSMYFRFAIPSFVTLIVYFALLFGVEKTKNSSTGLVMVFALTGFLGLTIGPIINHYIALRGMEPIVLALGSTATIFFGLSGYVLVTKKDMSFATGFIMTGVLVAFIAGLANMFLHLSSLALAVSCMFAFLSSMMIMWQTSAIIHGGERNYISATVTLFVSLYNIFLSLLQIFGIASDD
jgi:modulator of FtsH protease